ncbi:MAG: hypothetical protein L3K13_04490 [Thermoplasmata archaeon]|nr:hypothetical protein [Thermoplasmata archaeon]
MTEQYSDIRIRKARILQGKAREAADAVGAKDDDLVILKTSNYHSQPEYVAEKIQGDPMVHLLRVKNGQTKPD